MITIGFLCWKKRGWNYGVLPPEELDKDSIASWPSSDYDDNGSIFVEIPKKTFEEKVPVVKDIINNENVQKYTHIGNIYEIMLPTNDREEFIKVLKNKHNDNNRTEWGVEELEKKGQPCVHVTVPIDEEEILIQKMNKFEVSQADLVAYIYRIELKKEYTQEELQEYTLELQKHDLTVGHFLKNGTERRKDLFRFVCDIPKLGQMCIHVLHPTSMGENLIQRFQNIKGRGYNSVWKNGYAGYIIKHPYDVKHFFDKFHGVLLPMNGNEYINRVKDDSTRNKQQKLEGLRLLYNMRPSYLIQRYVHYCAIAIGAKEKDFNCLYEPIQKDIPEL